MKIKIDAFNGSTYVMVVDEEEKQCFFKEYVHPQTPRNLRKALKRANAFKDALNESA